MDLTIYFFYRHPVLFAQKYCVALHLCVDYRSINSDGRVKHYLIPNISELLDCISSCFCIFQLEFADRLRINWNWIHILAYICFCLQVWPVWVEAHEPWVDANMPSTFYFFMGKYMVGLREFCGCIWIVSLCIKPMWSNVWCTSACCFAMFA